MIDAIDDDLAKLTKLALPLKVARVCQHRGWTVRMTMRSCNALNAFNYFAVSRPMDDRDQSTDTPRSRQKCGHAAGKERFAGFPACGCANGTSLTGSANWATQSLFWLRWTSPASLVLALFATACLAS